jgi:hypothetical protein
LAKIVELRRRAFPDQWVTDGPGPDPRLVGMEELGNALLDAVYLARTGTYRDPENPPWMIPIPLAIAFLLQSAADEIVRWTEPDPVGDEEDDED